jgi:hypothetical protein
MPWCWIATPLGIIALGCLVLFRSVLLAAFLNFRRLIWNLTPVRVKKWWFRALLKLSDALLKLGIFLQMLGRSMQKSGRSLQELGRSPESWGRFLHGLLPWSPVHGAIVLGAVAGLAIAIWKLAVSRLAPAVKGAIGGGLVVVPLSLLVYRRYVGGRPRTPRDIEEVKKVDGLYNRS